MTRTAFVALAILLSPACRPAPGALTEADRVAIRQLTTNVANTLLAADYPAWAALFSEDGVIYSPNLPPIATRLAIQKWGETFPPVTELSFSRLEISGEANIAYATSRYVFATRGSPADSGKQLWVFRRAPAGHWEVVAASYSSDLPAVSR